MEATNNTPPQEIPVVDVLRNLADQLPEDLGAVDELRVQKITPQMYVCRVYRVAGGEFDVYEVRPE